VFDFMHKDHLHLKQLYLRGFNTLTFQVLLVIQQFSGLTVLNVYVVKIFHEVFNPHEVSNSAQNNTSEFNCEQINSTSKAVTSSEAYISGISTVLVRLISSLLLAGLLTKLSRRFMFMTSAFLTFFFLLCFATLNFFIQNGSSEGKKFFFEN
jgi:hypothetical protein